MYFGPILAALLSGAAFFYLFRLPRDSGRLAAQKQAAPKPAANPQRAADAWRFAGRSNS